MTPTTYTKQEVGKPYSAADARYVDFPKIGGRVPLWW